jgi:hypothetical protein
VNRGTDAGLSGGAITLACARQSGVSGTEYASQFTMRALYFSLRDGISFGGVPHDDSLVLCPAYGRHLIGVLLCSALCRDWSGAAKLSAVSPTRVTEVPLH